MKKRVLAIILVMSMVFGMMIPSYGTSVGGAESDDASAGVSDPVEESGEPTEEPPTETAPGEDEPPTESVLGEEDEPPTESVLGEEDVPSPDGEVDMSTSFLDTVDTINDKMKMQARAIPSNIYDEPAVQYEITYNTRRGNDNATGAWQDPVQTMGEALRRIQQRYNAGTKSFRLSMYDYDVSMISWPDGNYRWLLQSMVMDPNVVLIIETNTNIDFPTWFEGADKIACRYFALKSAMDLYVDVTARAGTRWAIEIAPGSTVLLRGVKITGGAVSDALVKVDSNSTTGVGATLNVGPTEYGNHPTELVGRSSLPVCIDNYGGTVNIGAASITGSPIGVKVDNGTLNMGGGTISGNTTGIHVQRASTVDITGGSISNNTTGISSLAGDNSICRYTISGSANISNNTGDGMTLSSTGVVVVNGGTINNNGGAGVNIGGLSRFDMNGGTINGNNYGLITSTSHTYGSVIAGGTISGSRTDGVSVRGGKCFIKNNSVIESNTNSGVNITGGTLSITGGTIRGNNVRVAGGTVTMSGGTITGAAGDGVVVASNATFTMSGGTISGHSTGAWVNGGTFNMSAGTIADNNRSGNKRGIHVGNGGRFTMSGSSTISGNEGSGVYIDGNSTVTIQAGTIRGNGQGVNLSNGTFNMENGTISGSTSNGVSVAGGNFNMSGGTISNNPVNGVSFAGNGTFTMSGNASITGSDNGVSVAGSGTFTMSGNASLTGNANGAKVTSGNFNMNGGTITGAIHDGVVVASNATFTMRGGSINGNNTGAWVNGGTFNMNGGTIADNNSGSNKRGIYVGSGGSFTMSGNSSISGHDDCGIGVYENATATISGSATISNNANGGIDFTTGASLTLSGSPSIIGNTRNGQPSNISLGSNKTITVTGVLSNSDPIGISVPTNSGNTIFANCDSSDAARSNRPKFQDDSNTRSVRNSSSNLILSDIDTSTIFVKSNGQDTNSGARDNPFATIQKALQEVAEGGTIYVMDNITEASSNLENAKSVTITTDPTRDSLCTIPEGENAVVTLNFPANSTHFIRQVNNATLTLQNITLKGDGTSTVSDSVLTIGAFNNADGIQGHIVLDNGATLQDFKTGIGAIGTTDSERSDCNVTVTIKAGAKIINNQVTVGTKQDVAGGISIWGLGALKMEGGEISNNTGPSGGIFIHRNPGTACNFNKHEITGGSITGNRSTGTDTGRFYAGGVFIRNDAQLTISNATITDNTAAGGDNSAGGVYIKDDTTALTLSGQVTINNNTKGGNASNISLPSSNSSITLGSSITGSVGVTQVGAAPQVVFATSNDSTVAANSASHFFDDTSALSVAANGSNLIWQNASRVYVSESGSDTTGLGTRDNPFQSIKKAIEVVADNGTIYVMSDLTDGTYNIDLSGKSAIIKTDEVRDNLCTIPSGQYATVTVSFTTDSHSNDGSTNEEDIAFIRVYGDNAPTLTLEEITFSGEGQSANNGSVFRAGAQFTGADAKSGHIILNNGATIQNFDTKRGAISTPGSGGLRPTITMNAGATIQQNTSNMDSGAVAGGITAWGGASFTMNGGTIQGNTGGIGGIFINNGALNITDGSIKDNIGSNSAGAGGIRINRGSGTITDATITGNKGAVGGIYTSVPTTITKSDISNNISNVDNANAAGGISVVSNTSTIKGCTITGNQTTSSGWGGGIFIAGGTSVIMEDADDGTGNTVTGNSCAGTDMAKAGGIHASGTLSLSGDVTVTGNSRGDNTASNVALNNASKRITLAGDVTGNVGVSHSDAVSGTVFASGTDASWATNSADSFFHDADTYCVRVLDDTLIWANFVAQIIQDGQTPVKYTTLTDAVNAYISPTGDNNNGYIIQLLDTVTTTFDPTVTINKTVYLDMNRHNIESPVTVEAGGTLYGLDSGTNTYQKALVDANGDATYGEITGGVTGNIQPLTTLTQSGKTMNYVAVKEGDNWSFHRFNVQVGEFTFMIDTAYQCGELWFYPTVQGDEKVMRALAGFGIQATNTVNQDHKETVVGSGDQTALDNNWSANGRYKYRGMLQRLSYTTAENKQRLLSDQFSMGGFLTFTNPNGGTEVRFNGPTNTRSFLEVLKRYYAESADATEKANIDTFITDNGLTSQWTATTWG